ncbi:MAG TPA: hypothetical protein VJ550_13370 [Geomonas sp.]|nr:hypothetical protein [Geomonas sp.]
MTAQTERAFTRSTHKSGATPVYPGYALGPGLANLLWLPFFLCALFYLLAELFLPD